MCRISDPNHMSINKYMYAVLAVLPLDQIPPHHIYVAQSMTFFLKIIIFPYWNDQKVATYLILNINHDLIFIIYQ